jgi:hypothetical protein
MARRGLRIVVKLENGSASWHHESCVDEFLPLWRCFCPLHAAGSNERATETPTPEMLKGLMPPIVRWTRLRMCSSTVQGSGARRASVVTREHSARLGKYAATRAVSPATGAATRRTGATALLDEDGTPGCRLEEYFRLSAVSRRMRDRVTTTRLPIVRFVQAAPISAMEFEHETRYRSSVRPLSSGPCRLRLSDRRRDRCWKWGDHRTRFGCSPRLGHRGMRDQDVLGHRPRPSRGSTPYGDNCGTLCSCPAGGGGLQPGGTCIFSSGCSCDHDGGGGGGCGVDEAGGVSPPPECYGTDETECCGAAVGPATCVGGAWMCGSARPSGCNGTACPMDAGGG